MENDLNARLAAMSAHFSKSQRALANYIVDHCDKAAFLTANKLGEAVGVSESTVVRFAVRLGYEGYPELQRAVQELIRNRLTAVQRLDVTASLLDEQNVLKSVMREDIDRISATLAVWMREFLTMWCVVLCAQSAFILLACDLRRHWRSFYIFTLI